MNLDPEKVFTKLSERVTHIFEGWELLVADLKDSPVSLQHHTRHYTGLLRGIQLTLFDTFMGTSAWRSDECDALRELIDVALNTMEDE